MDNHNKQHWKRSRKLKKNDIVELDKSSFMREKSHDNHEKKKSIRGTRAGRKIKNSKNEKKCLNLLIKNLASQCSENYTQKVMDESKSSKSKSPDDNAICTEKPQSCQVQPEGRSYRGKRAGRQVYQKLNCKKVAAFLSALAQECASH